MKKWIKGVMVASAILGAPLALTETITETIHAEEKQQQNTHVLIWGALIQAGYSEQATAGILANIEAESLSNPSYIQGGRSWEQFIKGATGIGIGQWTSATKQDEFFAFAEEQGVEWTDLGMQIDFLIQDLENEDWVDSRYKDFEEFKTTDDLDKATKMVMQGYCKPTDQSQLVVNERLNFAKDFMKEFGTPVVVEEKKEEPEKQEKAEPKTAKKEEKKAEPEKKDKKVEKQESQPQISPAVSEQEISPMTQEISTGIEETMKTSKESTKPYSNVPITQGIIEGKSVVYPILPVTTCAVLLGMAGVFAILLRQGYVDKIEDQLIVHQHRKKLAKRYNIETKKGGY